MIARKLAQDRSIAEPAFGLAQGVDGIVAGTGSNDPRGTVIEMEHRRKSGRSVTEWFVLPTFTSRQQLQQKELVVLLEDHLLYPRPASLEPQVGDEQPDSTFNLGLTDEQRRERDKVVLPYFDAQKDGGVGEGGRILYDMGVEDDFDEEEDEI